MKHIAITVLIVILGVMLAGCGGGTSTPDPGSNDTPEPTQLLAPTPPTSVVGDHGTSVVPDQLNVLTGANTPALDAQLERFGISVAHKNGGWATLDLPSGTDLDWAIGELEKEYNITRAEKVHVLHTARAEYDKAAVRAASYLPFDPMFADDFSTLGFDHENQVWTYLTGWVGQAVPMNTSNWQAAWDVSLQPGPAGREVRVAVIDAGFANWRRGNSFVPTDPDLVDSDHSGFVAADGTVTTGLAAAEWDLYDHDADPGSAELPYRIEGELVLGMLADDIGDPVVQNGYIIQGYDFDGEGIEDSDWWNEGIAGMNPNATYIVIKTGQINGGNDGWEFSDNHLAEAIDYAAALSTDDNGGLWPNGGCEADIILLGMFANADVGGNVSTAIATARTNNALVIAPAGDVTHTATFAGDPPVFDGWGETPVDISVTPVTPASDPNCIAVCGTGINRQGDLGQFTAGSDTYNNLGIGWAPTFGDPFEFTYREIPDYCNTGGDIAAMAYGIGAGYHPFLVAGDPSERIPGYTYNITYNSFGSIYAAAYVTGAASIVHQALHEANNAEPTDDDVWAALSNDGVDLWQFAPLTGLAGGGGFLDAGASAWHAFSGGTLYQRGMSWQTIEWSQPLGAVTRGTDFEITPTVNLGNAPFILTVDWDNGLGEVVVDPWVNGDPVTLTGGWDTLGLKGVNMTVEDADGQLDTFALELHVINPLSAGITITNIAGSIIQPTNLGAGVSNRWNANLTNVYEGEIGGVQNVMSFDWDFGDGLGTSTSENPSYGFPTADSYTVTLTVSETARPDSVFTLDVTVN